MSIAVDVYAFSTSTWTVKNMELPKRKQTRCPYIDYSKTGAYFITFSTLERRNYFWMFPDRKYTSPDEIELNSIGIAVKETLLKISEHYPYTSLDYYVIMPDHVHLLLCDLPPKEGEAVPRKDITVLASQIKGTVTKKSENPYGRNRFSIT